MAEVAPSAAVFQDGGRNTREIITPEAIPLTVELAPLSERATAFIIDFVFWNMAVFLIVLPISLLIFASVTPEIVIGLILLVSFLIRNTYFLHFELSWRGATPGKRIVGLRVIDRNGGPLLPSAVITRNLTREFEVFMPVTVLLSFQDVAMGQWSQWLFLAWLLAIGAIPFLNRDSMRGGDLIAGTIVICLRRRSLLADQALNEFHYTFTDRQLLAYGNYELHVLEEVLRGAATSLYSKEMLRHIGEKIRNKIGWTTEVPLDLEESFLRDFYTAERAFLEREQLFGKVRLDKHHQSKSEQGRLPPARG
jgi:uncharacterized RDD family membrane protein YckC